MKIAVIASNHKFYIRKPDVYWLPEYILVLDHEDATDFRLTEVGAAHREFKQQYPDLILHNEEPTK
jgi:hypothetical protein